MPWTFAHPAAVLPLRRLKHLSFGALVVGSIAPDIGYYLGCFNFAAAAHTLRGLVTICLPTGLALVALVRILHRPVAILLPGPHRQALLGLPQMPPLASPMMLWQVSISVVIGATTHAAWDSLTHGTGYFVSMWPSLRNTAFILGTRSIPLFEMLQHASTALGMGVIAVAYVRWLRTVDLGSGDPDPLSDRWRYGLLGALALTSLVAAIPVTYFLSTSKPGGTNVTISVVRYVISSTTVFVVTLSAAALWVSRRHVSAPRGDGQPELHSGRTFGRHGR